MSTQGLSVDDLLALSARSGYSATSRQVERWHKAGLLPRRRQYHVSGHRGSTGLYPPETERQFLALCRLRSRHRSLLEACFWLWWDGYPIAPAKLQLSIRRLLRPSSEWTRLSNRHSDAFDAAEEASKQMATQARRAPAMQALRRNLKNNDEDIGTALFDIAQIAFGSKPIWNGDGWERELGEVSPKEIMFQGLGLDRAAADRAGEIGPWLEGGAEMIPQVFGLLRKGGFKDWRSLVTLIESAKAQELEQAREDAHLFAEDLPAFAMLLRIQYGRKAFGFELLHVPAANNARFRAQAVAFCLVFRRAGIGQGIDALLDSDSLREAAATARIFASFARAFPQYKRYLRPMAEGRKDAIPREVEEALRQVMAEVQT